MSAVPIREAARTLKVTKRTVQNWLSQGAPRFGQRGRGALVDPEALLQWRSTRKEVDLSRIAAGLWRAYAMAPEGYKEPAWAELGVGRFKAAALLAESFAAIAIELTGKPPEKVPLEIQRLTAIALRKETPYTEILPTAAIPSSRGISRSKQSSPKSKGEDEISP